MENTNWREVKEFREKLKASVDRFIEAIPTMEEEQVKEAMDKYLSAIPKAYDKEEYRNNAISNLKKKVERALKAADSFNMPSFLIPAITPTKSNVKNELVLYCQVAEDNLSKSARDSRYNKVVNNMKQWYINDAKSKFAPILAEVKEYPIEVAETAVEKVWNIVVKGFQTNE